MQAECGWIQRRYGVKIDPEWILFSAGVIDSLFFCVRALTEPTDAILIQPPVYGPFYRAVNSFGRKLALNRLIETEDGWKMDFDDMEKQFASGVKMMILCSPHNPVGRVWSRDELSRVIALANRYGVIVIADEIHADFVFEGSHQVLVGLKESYRKFVVTCTAPSKTFNLAGLQVSNIFIPDDALRRKFEQAVAASGYSQLNTMGLVACEAAYRYGEEWYDAVKAYIRENLAYAQHFLEEQIPQVKTVKPEGTYLLWVDFRSLGLSRKELEELIVKKAGLWLDSGDIFGAAGRGFERINVACPRSVLTEALERLARAVRECVK